MCSESTKDRDYHNYPDADNQPWHFVTYQCKRCGKWFTIYSVFLACTLYAQFPNLPDQASDKVVFGDPYTDRSTNAGNKHVPEQSSLLLLGVGLGLIAIYTKRAKRKTHEAQKG